MMMIDFLNAYSLMFSSQMTAIPSIEESEKLSKLNSQYQIQYKKNFYLMKTKYRKWINPSISFNEVRNCIIFFEEKNKYLEGVSIFEGCLKEDSNQQIFWKRIYCFLVSLAFYEIDFQKFHKFYVSNYFIIFS